MASPSTFGPRMLRCPACNAGLPVDGTSSVATCSYCSARVEIDRRGQPRAPTHTTHTTHTTATPQRSMAWMSWLMVPIVLMFSGGMAFYQWYRAQSLVTVPSPAPVVATPKPTPQPITTVRQIAAPAPVATPDPEPKVVAPTPDPPPPSAPAKPHRAPKPPPPTGPTISVEEARKQLEPMALACLKQAKGHHLRAYMGNTTAGAVKVLPDTRTELDGKKVALAKTPLGRCLNAAGAKVNTSAFKSNYVRLDVRD